jgi:glycosyltransferase involved in cell wall biosynthesis
MITQPHIHDPAAGRAPSATIDGRPLRVLMVTARYLPERGGTEIHTHEVAQRIAGYGAEVTILCTEPTAPFAPVSQDGPVRVLRVRSWPPGRDYYLAPKLTARIRREDADIVHLQGYHTLVAPLTMIGALLARRPYVVTLHSGGHSSRLRRAVRPAQARALRPLLARAGQLVAGSVFEAELFAQRTRLPPAAFRVVPSGVDLPAVDDDVVASDPPVLLSIGRVESYKGHQRVVEALPAVERVRPGTRLRIVGSGPYESQLRELAQRLGVADRLEIAPIPADRRDVMARIMQSAACVVALSEYESQGLAIQEALALGRPLVVSDNSALSDLRHHANVRSISRETASGGVASAILELLDAPPVTVPPTLSTWDQCASALLEVYRETLASRP